MSTIDQGSEDAPAPSLLFRKIVWADETWRGNPAVELVLKNTTNHTIILPGMPGDELSEPEIRVPLTYATVERLVDDNWKNITAMADGLAVEHSIQPGAEVLLRALLPDDVQPGWTLRITISSITSAPFQVPDKNEQSPDALNG